MTIRSVGHDGAEVSVVLALIDRERDQWHVGVSYVTVDGDKRVLDHGWERRLKDQRQDNFFRDNIGAVVGINLPESTADAFAALCTQIVSNSRAGFKYELRETGARLDNGVQTDDRGFTCATFVLAIFRTVLNDELLALGTWPPPDEVDIQWQEQMTKLLVPALFERLGNTEDFRRERDRRRAMIPCKRVRPTDVAGGACCAVEQWPVSFECARIMGEGLSEFVKG